MTEAGGYASFLRVREAIDARSRHERIWRLAAHHLGTPASGRPVRVLELGAGVGGLLCHMLEAFNGPLLEYTIIDIEQEHLAALEVTLLRFGEVGGYVVEREGEAWVLRKGGRRMAIRVLRADVWEVLQPSDIKRPGWEADLVVAQAFLDLFDVDVLLPRLIAQTAPGGGLYFPITFDGVTCWLPEYEALVDAQVEHFYHATMDARRLPGERGRRSQSGRRVLSWLASCSDVAFWDAGGSDWLVGGQADAPEAAEVCLFLHSLLDGYEREAAVAGAGAPAGISNWLDTRRKQVDANAAILMVHQLDLYARRRVSEHGAVRDDA